MTTSPPARQRYDVVILGGGHNGLTAAAYLAKAGRSVLVLERLDHVGGAAVSAQAFPGVDARLSRYSYLVSLLPSAIVRDLGLDVRVKRRRVSSYTPVPGHPGGIGLLVDREDDVATRGSFAAVSGDRKAAGAWKAFYAAKAGLAQRVFASLTEPLRTRMELRGHLDDDAVWEAFVERPIGEVIERSFADDTTRGVIMTDALVGTFAAAHEASLQQNRCYLYHVIGGGTGDWDVPVGGMGAVSGALAKAARDAGTELVTGAEVTHVDPGGAVTWQDSAGAGGTVAGGHILANLAPHVLARLLGEEPPGPAPEGSQLKVNLVLSRLPRLKDPSVDPRIAFTGTFHVNQTYDQLAVAHQEAEAGAVPALIPCESYCHSLTDPTILGPGLAASGAHTVTVFALHLPHRLITPESNDAFRAEALSGVLRSLNSVLAEPIEECLLRDRDGRPCIEAKTTLDIEREVGLPGGNIFQRDLAWPFVEEGAPLGTPAERWGVNTAHAKVLLAGAGARRGGGVSGIPGHNAARAVLEASQTKVP